MQVKVRAVPVHELAAKQQSETSEQIKVRVQQAREQQYQRFKNTSVHANSEMTSTDVRNYCHLTDDANQLLKTAVERMHLSARAYNRTIKVARTIADLSHEERITKMHIGESLQYRFGESL